MPEADSGNGSHRAAPRFSRTQLNALSVLLDRAEFANSLGLTFPTQTVSTSLFKRDVYAALGWARSLTPSDYRQMYERGGIAERLVDAYPNATWRGGGAVIEDEDPDTETEFERAFNALAERLKLWPALKRTDVLAGLGRFAVLVIGAPGEMREELTPVRNPADIVGLWPYSEQHVTIHETEQDSASPRFGLPTVYQIDVADFSSSSGAVTNRGTRQRKVHYSRVIHVADGRLDNDIFGKPRLRAVWNYLEDLTKIHGGGSESFWRGAFPGTQIKMDPEALATLSDAQQAAVDDEVDEWRHGLSDVLRTAGMEMEQFPTRTVAFNANLDSLLTLISGATGIPKRILLGSERGELASTQDRSSWNERVTSRRADFAEPVVVRPLVDRLIELRALPEPADHYKIAWPEMEVLTEDEKIGVADKMASVNERQFRAGQPPVFSDSEIREVTGRQPLTSSLPPAEPREAADADREPWEAVNDAAEKHVDALSQAVVGALGSVGEALDADEIEALIASENHAGLRRKLESTTRTMLQSAVAPIAAVLLSTLVAGGEAAAETAVARHGLLRAAQFDIAFDKTNPAAQNWALHHAGLMISEEAPGVSITAATIQGVRDITTLAFALGVPPRKAAQFVRDTVGLTGLQAGYVDTLRSELLNAKPGDVISRFRPRPGVRTKPGFNVRVPSGGPTPEWVERRVARYARMQHNWRARNIARSETLRASAEGQRQLWVQSQEKSLLPLDIERARIPTPDDRLCLQCSAVAYERAKVNEPYKSTGDMTPLVHSQCRCGEALDGPGSRLPKYQPGGSLPPASQPLDAPVPPSIQNDLLAETANLTDQQKAAIQEYTLGSNAHINQDLRAGGWVRPELARTVQGLEAALDSAGVRQETLTVWRGVTQGNMSDEQFAAFIAKFQPGKTITLRGFQSTSLDSRVAFEQFGSGPTGTVFEIKTREGIYLRPFSSIPAEEEFLLAHNTRYKVIGVRTETVKGVERRVISLEAQSSPSMSQLVRDLERSLDKPVIRMTDAEVKDAGIALGDLQRHMGPAEWRWRNLEIATPTDLAYEAEGVLGGDWKASDLRSRSDRQNVIRRILIKEGFMGG